MRQIFYEIDWVGDTMVLDVFDADCNLIDSMITLDRYNERYGAVARKRPIDPITRTRMLTLLGRLNRLDVLEHTERQLPLFSEGGAAL